MKRVLMFFPGEIYPVMMANQKRFFDKVEFLSKYCHVTVVYVTMDKANLVSTDYCKNVDLIAIKYPSKFSLIGFLLRIISYIQRLLFKTPLCVSYIKSRYIVKKIKEISRSNFDILMFDYWYSSFLFTFFNASKCIIDSHDVLSDSVKLKKGDSLYYKKYFYLENKFLDYADEIISISNVDLLHYKTAFPLKKHSLIPIGYKFNFDFDIIDSAVKSNIILFYGALSSEQNQVAFKTLWDEIFPIIKKAVPDASLLVVGSNPPKWIEDLNKLNFVTVTGYVVDPLNAMNSAKIHILPLSISTGLRGRVMEPMFLGIPVIGTSNALGSLGITHNENGFIFDDNSEIATCAISLLKDTEYCQTLSVKSRSFIINNYSYAQTYDRLLSVLL